MKKEKIGEKLRQYRKLHNMTEKEVADYLHVKRRIYTCYEMGCIIPSNKMLMRLANLYNISISQFKEYSYTEDWKQYSEEAENINNDELILINYFRQLNDVERKGFLKFIKNKAEGKMEKNV